MSPLKGQCHEIFASGFFHESPSLKPLKITLGSFQFYSKIRGDIRKSRCTTGVNDTGGKLLPVSTTPAANLPPVSTTSAANFPTSSGRCQWHRRQIYRRWQQRWWQIATGINDTGGKFCHGVNDTGGAPWLANISENFRKILKWS